ncbi:MAG: hypothetical protein OEW87_10745 [Flavobacteriaceae bacterium]|nr:hypothetical protein [Flavobacteriaceae bacterium]
MENKNLLREIENFDKANLLQEDKKMKNVLFRAVVHNADKVTGNKTLYSSTLLNKVVKDLKGKIEAGQLYGTQDHPGGQAKLANVSHRITNAYMKNNQMWIEGIILSDTNEGKKILSMIKSGGKVGLSSRGFGTSTPKDGVNIINDDYVMAGVDFVLNPSVGNAQVDQSNIFESMPLELTEKKNVVSLAEFNDLVDDQLRHSYEISFPDANFNEEKTEEHFEKYCDERWLDMSNRIEKILNNSGRIVEPTASEAQVMKTVIDEKQKLLKEYGEYLASLSVGLTPVTFEKFKETFSKK